MKKDKLSREYKLLNYLNVSDGIGIEIGPSYNPILSKNNGYNVITVDHCSQDELKNKYRNDSTVNIDKIEEVDFVWESGSLCDLIKKQNYFDYVVASHIIEHIPNPILWLQDLSLLLKNDGYLSLAVPNKEYCFDFTRPITTTGEWLLAYHEKRDKHSLATLCDSNLYRVVIDNSIYAWGNNNDGSLSYDVDIDMFYNNYLDNSEKSVYVDCHFSVFTPVSFQLLIYELNYFGLIDFIIEKMYPSEGCEFIIILRKSSNKINRDDVLAIRDEYLKSIPRNYPEIMKKYFNIQLKIFHLLRKIYRKLRRFISFLKSLFIFKR